MAGLVVLGLPAHPDRALLRILLDPQRADRRDAPVATADRAGRRSRHLMGRCAAAARHPRGPADAVHAGRLALLETLAGSDRAQSRALRLARTDPAELRVDLDRS